MISDDNVSVHLSTEIVDEDTKALDRILKFIVRQSKHPGVLKKHLNHHEAAISLTMTALANLVYFSTEEDHEIFAAQMVASDFIELVRNASKMVKQNKHKIIEALEQAEGRTE